MEQKTQKKKANKNDLVATGRVGRTRRRTTSLRISSSKSVVLRCEGLWGWGCVAEAGLGVTAGAGEFGAAFSQWRVVVAWWGQVFMVPCSVCKRSKNIGVCGWGDAAIG